MNGFLGELRRRNVFKVAAIYAVTGWLLIQVAAIAFPTFAAPDWVLRVFIFLVLLGFPLALIVAWAVELTPEGPRRAEATVGETRMWIVATALTALAIGWYHYGQPAGPAPEAGLATSAPQKGPTPADYTVDEKSIAVLPFVDLSQEGDQAFFGDGMAEEILNLLAKNPELRVAGRTSAFKFRGQEEDLREIGEALNVAHVLEGSVRKAGMQVRITAQLIDTDSGFHLWSETYDTEMTNIFDVQDRISGAIVKALEATISGNASGAHRAAPTDNLDAYNLYLRSLPYIHSRGEKNIDTAIRLLEAAVAMDPSFFEATSMLAFAHALTLYWDGFLAPEVAFQRVQDLANEVLMARPGDDNALLARGTASLYYDGDWNGAERDLRAAYEANPGNPNIANFLGDMYRYFGNIELGLLYEEMSVKLDPLSAISHHDYSHALFMADRLADAVAEASRAVELEPGLVGIKFTLLQFLVQAQEFEAADALVAELVALDTRRSPRLVYDAMRARAFGTDAEVREVIARYRQLEDPTPGSQRMLIDLYLTAGDCDAAGELFNIDVRTRIVAGNMPYLVISDEQCPDSEAWQSAWDVPSMQQLSDRRRANNVPLNNIFRREL